MRWLKRRRAQGLFEQAAGDAVREMRLWVAPEAQPFAACIVVGGCVAAHAAITIVPVLRPEWGSGSAIKARALSLVFSLAVLSRWLASTPDDRMGASEGERESARREAAIAIMDSLAPGPPGREPSADDLAWFLSYDTQFRYEWRRAKDEERNFSVAPDMLVVCALSAVGGPATRFPRGGFPYKGMLDYADRGGASPSTWDPIEYVANYAAVMSCLRRGYEASLKHYEELQR